MALAHRSNLSSCFHGSSFHLLVALKKYYAFPCYGLGHHTVASYWVIIEFCVHFVFYLTHLSEHLLFSLQLYVVGYTEIKVCVNLLGFLCFLLIPDQIQLWDLCVHVCVCVCVCVCVHACMRVHAFQMTNL
jgi:hypothetical protein